MLDQNDLIMEVANGGIRFKEEEKMIFPRNGAQFEIVDGPTLGYIDGGEFCYVHPKEDPHFNYHRKVEYREGQLFTLDGKQIHLAWLSADFHVRRIPEKCLT